MLQVRKQSLREGKSLSKVIASTRMLRVKPKSELKAHVLLMASLALFFSWLAPHRLGLSDTGLPGRPSLLSPTPLILCQSLIHSFMAHIILRSPSYRGNYYSSSCYVLISPPLRKFCGDKEGLCLT